MGIKGYDAWRTASPPEYDYDPVEEAERLVEEYRRAKMNWEADPGPWRYYLDKMADSIQELMDYIDANV